MAHLNQPDPFDFPQVDLLANANTPVAVNDFYSMTENTVLAGGLLTDDFALSGSAVTVTAIDGTDFTGGISQTLSHGTLTVEQDGSFEYTPDQGFSGLQTCSYTITSPSGATASALVYLDVVPLPPRIAALPGLLSFTENSSWPSIDGISISDPNSSANGIMVAFDVDEGRLAISGYGPSQGVYPDPGNGGFRDLGNKRCQEPFCASVSSNGGFRYTPVSDSLDDDSFSYTMSNGTTTAVATATLSITPAQPEFTAPAGLSVAPGDSLDVGGLSLSDANAGSDVTVTLSSGYGSTLALYTSLLTEGTVSNNDTDDVTVEAPLSEINSTLAPASGLVYTASSTLVDDTLTVTENSFANGGTSQSFSVPISQQATASSFSVSQPSSYALENSGMEIVTVTRGGSLAGSASVRYNTANGNASSGTNYTSTSGTLSFAPGQVADTIAVPLIAGGTLSGGQGTFNLNLGTPSSGATITADNAQVDLLADANTPVAANDFYTMTENQMVAGGLLASDFTLSGSTVTVTAINGTDFTGGLSETLSHGTLTVEQDGSFEYTPNQGFSGVQTCSYTITSPSGATASAMVYLNVQPVAPLITNLPAKLSVEENSASQSIPYITISDPSGASGIMVVFEVEEGYLSCAYGPSQGVFPDAPYIRHLTVTGSLCDINAMLAAGALEYAPFDNYDGADELSVTVQDLSDSLLSTTERVPIGIASDWTYANYHGGTMRVSVPGPECVPPGLSVDLGGIYASAAAAQAVYGTTTITVDLTVVGVGTLEVNNPSVSGVTVETMGAPTYGVQLTGSLDQINLLLANISSVVYNTPDAMTTGPQELDVTVSAGSPGGLAVEPAGEAVPISITPPGTAAVAPFAVAEGTPLTAVTGSLFTNGPGDGLHAVIASAPQHGYVTLNAYGGFTYTPIAGYIGPDQFRYYSWDFFTGSAPQAQTVKLAVGGDGGNMPEDLVLMVDVDAEDAVVDAPLQPTSPAVSPGRTTVAPPPARVRPQAPPQDLARMFLETFGEDLLGVANGLLSPIESFNALRSRSIQIYQASSGQSYTGTADQQFSVLLNFVTQLTPSSLIAETTVGADAATGRQLSSSEQLQRGLFATGQTLLVLAGGLAAVEVPPGAVAGTTSPLEQILNTDVNVAFRNVSSRVFRRGGTGALRPGLGTRCFTAGTLVATNEGFRPIETISPGDRVWSFDVVKQQWRLCRVLEPYSIAYDGTLVLVTIAGETTEATYQHPYWVVRGEELAYRPRAQHLAKVPPDAKMPGRWVDSCDLRVGDEVLLRDGRIVPVEKLEHRFFEGAVYNMEVDDLHCYTVGRNSVLVHNSCGGLTGPDIPAPNSQLPLQGFRGSQGPNPFHALDRAIERGVSPQAILQTLRTQPFQHVS